MRTLKTKKNLLPHIGTGVMLTIPLGFNLINGNLSRVTGYSSCREIAIRQYADFMISVPPKRKDYARRYKINKRIIQAKSRIIFPSLDDTMFKDIISGTTLKTLHLIEKSLNMPKTYPVELLMADGSSFVHKKVMFVGSNKWYRSSHTMSLWLLILRLGFRVPEFTGKTIADLTKLAANYNKVSSSGGNSIAVDKTYVRHTFHSWIPLMENLNSVFSPKVPWINRFNYKKTHVKLPSDMYGHGNIGTEGISKLIKDSRHVDAPKFNKILNKILKKSK